MYLEDHFGGFEGLSVGEDCGAAIGACLFVLIYAPSFQFIADYPKSHVKNNGSD